MKIQSPQDLGAYVRVERKKRRWTQAELASRAGVKPLWISQFERGKPSAQIGLVVRTLKALGVAISVSSSTRSAGGATGVDLDSLVRPLREEVVAEPEETTDEANRRAMTDGEEKELAMSEILEALVQGVSMGQLIYDEKKDRVSFRYDEQWVDSPDAFPLSLSMPLVKREHSDAVVRPFISGLLPDNSGILDQWGRRYQVSPRNPFRLLVHVGEECAGAVQFVQPERASRWQAGNAPAGIDWLSDGDLEERIRELIDDHSAARRAGDRGQFSLAGAQPKMGLFRDDENGRWGVPEGETPTTHILKPNVGPFADYDQNEHFCLNLAARIGLPAAQSRTEMIGGTPVIIVTRFDRVHQGGHTIRVHQEDTCQSMAVMPSLKYENEGGPSAGDIFGLIRDYSSRPAEDESRFFDALIFNWLIKGTDAHAKNVAFLLASGPQVRLAPLYDLSSFHPYERKGEERKTRLAMKVGGEYHFDRMGPRSWEKAARAWKLNRDFVIERIRDQSSKLIEVTKSVAADIETKEPKPQQQGTLDRLVSGILQEAGSAVTLF